MTSEILFYLDSYLARHKGSALYVSLSKPGKHQLYRVCLRDWNHALIATAIGPSQRRAMELLDLKLSLTPEPNHES